jgi:cellulose synthase/poly-beta-1,6-N-acetylglucosamine synthase-like glycosyltransferase
VTAPLPRWLPPTGAAPLPHPPKDSRLGLRLLREGLVMPHDLVRALALSAQGEGRLEDVLLTRGMIAEEVMYDTLSLYGDLPRLDPLALPPDPRLIDRAGAAFCLREGLLPWRNSGPATVIAVAQTEVFRQHRPLLEELFGTVTPALAPRGQIVAALMAARGAALKQAAETRVPAAESCRSWGGGALPFWFGLALALLTGMLWIAPVRLLSGLMAWAALTLILATGLKLAAAVAWLRRRSAPETPPLIARLPVVSVMVALYREGDIAARLLRRLGKLDYPPDRLDILLVVEEDDHVTRNALAQAGLPGWLRVVVVPDGPLKTKPRALNFALDHCRGSIIGVYDAEDAPAPDQIRRVVDRFHQRGAEVACLQGVLDFYNPRTNWLSRCFTIEYATWFRIVLPGLQRLGLAIPLGGTTLFFRRAALEQLGGWDAHNVTEDADLGIRLARHGFRTEVIDTVTEEEANCRPLPWVKQRSRWLKGYMMTYLVHMRDPALLWRQLGPRKFWGFQVLFLATLTQFVLAPLLWSFWIVSFGFAHPVSGVMHDLANLALGLIYIATEVVNIGLGILALRMTRHGLSPLWVPTLAVYFPLGTLASYKAAWEMVTKPFYWDKTSHGHFDDT